MKKVFSGIIATVFVLLLCAATAFAAEPKGGCNFTDANEDGICDNCGTYHLRSMAGNHCGRNFVDADGDGVCDNFLPIQGKRAGQGNGAQDGRGGNFVDADGDGVCDNYVSGQSQGGYGCGSQGGRGNGSQGGRGNGCRGGRGNGCCGGRGR